MTTLLFDRRTGTHRRTMDGVRRLGLAGFLFFFAKGLVWLAIAAAGWAFGGW